MKTALSPEGFERLLARLDADRERAGARYEILRGKLVRFFEWRGVPDPEELADETIDRVARRLAGGEEIASDDPGAYFHGVARNVLREHWDHTQRSKGDVPIDGDLPDLSRDEGGADDEPRLGCFEHCLAGLAPETRQLVLRYYTDEKRAKIDGRQQMAQALGIGLNALRIRMFRVRATLVECVRGCLGGETKTPPAHAGSEGGRA
jgi:DNA-directed RNA polymerase specialized sigma24 family protein